MPQNVPPPFFFLVEAIAITNHNIPIKQKSIPQDSVPSLGLTQTRALSNEKIQTQSKILAQIS
jgi:hypothetical protein